MNGQFPFRPYRVMRGRVSLGLFQFAILIIGFHHVLTEGRSMNERHSYSLTTFDTTGKLGQVERAMEAAQHGTPIVAVVHSNSVILAAPQVLPSPFCIDDGTPRFTLVTNEILVSHSGLAADGRILAAAARRLAIEHEYTFNESIELPVFLEEMALLLQKYTLEPATRPFGACLVVVFVPQQNRCTDVDSHSSILQPQLYRMDPSGNVERLEHPVAIVHGGTLFQDSELLDHLHDIATKEDNDVVATDICNHVAIVLQKALHQQVKKRGDREDPIDSTILTAFLKHQIDCDGDHSTAFQTIRHKQNESVEL